MTLIIKYMLMVLIQHKVSNISAMSWWRYETIVSACTIQRV